MRLPLLCILYRASCTQSDSQLMLALGQEIGNAIFDALTLYTKLGDLYGDHFTHAYLHVLRPGLESQT